MEKEAGLPGVHQHNPDCDIWAHEYFAPSWFCLPNNQSALTVVRPGDTARDTLELICKVGAAGACGLEESGGSAGWALWCQGPGGDPGVSHSSGLLGASVRCGGPFTLGRPGLFVQRACLVCEEHIPYGTCALRRSSEK